MTAFQRMPKSAVFETELVPQGGNCIWNAWLPAEKEGKTMPIPSEKHKIHNSQFKTL